MLTWHKISLVAVLLIGFQFLLPNEGVTFLGRSEVQVGDLSLPAPVVEENRMDSVYFFGDMMLSRDVERRMTQSGDEFPFAGFSIPSSSYAIANFESAVPDNHVPAPNNTFRFSTRESSLKAVATAGFTHVGLANNHTFDFGLAGYNQTVTNVWDAGLIPFGHPSVVSLPSYTVVEVGSKSVGVIALHTLYSEPTRDAIATVLETMTDESDLQIAYVHWGEEYVDTPSTAQRNFAKLLAELGVDIVIGHHPHVVQSVEVVDGTLVFYSLGNFIFDQYFSISVQQGLGLKLVLGEEEYIEIIPLSSLDTRNQPREMTAENKATFLTYLASISDPALSAIIQSGRVSLTELLAITPEVVIMTE